MKRKGTALRRFSLSSLSIDQSDQGIAQREYHPSFIVCRVGLLIVIAQIDPIPIIGITPVGIAFYDAEGIPDPVFDFLFHLPQL